MHHDARHEARQAHGMDDFIDDDLFLDAVDHVVLEALAVIGDDPQARFAFFRRLVTTARNVVARREGRSSEMLQ